jgi:hypothetical protein
MNESFEARTPTNLNFDNRGSEVKLIELEEDSEFFQPRVSVTNSVVDRMEKEILFGDGKDYVDHEGLRIEEAKKVL